MIINIIYVRKKNAKNSDDKEILDKLKKIQNNKDNWKNNIDKVAVFL